MFKIAESRYIALLGCSHTDLNWLVCLVLQVDTAGLGSARGAAQSLMYHCLSTPNGDHCTLLHSDISHGLEWEFKDIYISTRPAYREGSITPLMSIARLMANSPERPYQFTPAAVGRWGRDYGLQGPVQRLTLSDVQMPPLPWTVSSPVVLLFKHYPLSSSNYSWLTLTLGHCTEVEGSESTEEGGDTFISHTPSPGPESPLGHHYAVTHYGNVQDSIWSPHILSIASHHSCKKNHLRFKRIPEDPEWAQFSVDWRLRIVFKLDEARCMLRDLSFSPSDEEEEVLGLDDARITE